MPRHYEFDDDDDDYGDDEDGVVLVTSVVRNENEKIKFTCTLCPGSTKEYRSHAGLVEHKIRARHPYCVKCDQDFNSDTALEQHIIFSSKHITCAHCQREFKSESGLSLHMEQTHRQAMGGICPKCQEVFTTRSGLLQHVEGSLCPGGLSKTDFTNNIAANQRIQNDLLRAQTAGPTGDMVPFKDPEGRDFLNSWTHFKIFDDRTADLRDANGRIQTKAEWYDRTTDLWICPFSGCRKKFKAGVAFDQHLNSVAHAARTFTCPGCKDRFASPSAMLQHVESGTCRIRTMPEQLRLVTRGLTNLLQDDQQEKLRRGLAGSRVAGANLTQTVVTSTSRTRSSYN